MISEHTYCIRVASNYKFRATKINFNFHRIAPCNNLLINEYTLKIEIRNGGRPDQASAPSMTSYVEERLAPFPGNEAKRRRLERKQKILHAIRCEAATSAICTQREKCKLRARHRARRPEIRSKIKGRCEPLRAPRGRVAGLTSHMGTEDRKIEHLYTHVKVSESFLQYFCGTLERSDADSRFATIR